jgi:hypothetical protein
MLIYEKDNKLNINFENSVNESPDLQICKSGDKTEVLIDGQSGGGGSGPLVVTFSGTTAGGDAACDKTWAEIVAAESAGRNIKAFYQIRSHGELHLNQMFCISKYTNNTLTEFLAMDVRVDSAANNALFASTLVEYNSTNLNIES